MYDVQCMIYVIDYAYGRLTSYIIYLMLTFPFN